VELHPERPNVAFGAWDAPNVAFGASHATNATLGRSGPWGLICPPDNGKDLTG